VVVVGERHAQGIQSAYQALALMFFNGHHLLPLQF
jgi:hypothetical protein